MTRTRIAVVAATLVLGAGLLVACSSSTSKPSSGGSTPGTSASSSSSSGSPNTVEVKNFAFSPSSLTVTKGTTVTWKFEDSTAHTATASDGKFNSNSKSSGQTYSFTFNSAGTYNYICTFHQYMKGSVTVH